MNQHVTWFLLAVWFIVCSALILWLGTLTTKAFDPSLRLNQAMMDVTFELRLSEVLASVAPDAENQPEGYIFHIGQGSCFCESLAKPHQNSLDEWGKNNNFVSTKLDVKDIDPQLKIIPSTPAVIALDSDKNLIYMGPYSRGAGCFSTSGMVDEQLALWKDTIQSQSDTNAKPLHSVIETEADGCYCHV